MHKFSPAHCLVAALSLASIAATAATTAGTTTSSGAMTSSGSTVAATTSPTNGSTVTATNSTSGTLRESPALQPPPLTTPPATLPVPAPDTVPPTTPPAQIPPAGTALPTQTPPDTSTLAPSNQTSGTVPGSPVAPQTIGTRPVPFDSGIGAVTTEGGVTPQTEDFVIGANGERIPVNRAASVLPAPATATPTPELNAAMRSSAEQTRKKVARKGQLLHSITPRTNADKSDQMPDDPVSPALTLPAEAPKIR